MTWTDGEGQVYDSARALLTADGTMIFPYHVPGGGAMRLLAVSSFTFSGYWSRGVISGLRRRP